MKGFETNSKVRLAFRKRIRAIVDAWVYGEPERLEGEDLKKLKAKLREDWTEKRSGYRYAAWCAEINLVLGIGKDPAARLRKKKGSAPVVWDDLSLKERVWLEENGGRCRVVERVPQAPVLGPLFGRVNGEK